LAQWALGRVMAILAATDGNGYKVVHAGQLIEAGTQ
jgi:hypothetical protein